MVLRLLLGAQVSSPARRLLAAAPPPSPPRPGPLCGLCPPRPRPGLLPLSLSASPRASGGVRSRGAPGKMAAAGGGGGEGGAGLGGAAGPGLGSGSGPRGPGPSAGASEDARGPAPSALHPEEVAARLQRMHRELSNRRKILVKNLPQDSNCQVRRQRWEATRPGGIGAGLRWEAAPRHPGSCPAPWNGREDEGGRCGVRTVCRFCKGF